MDEQDNNTPIAVDESEVKYRFGNYKEIVASACMLQNLIKMIVDTREKKIGRVCNVECVKK